MDIQEKEYELLYFVPVNLAPEAIREIGQKVKEIIIKNNSEIIKEKEVGKRKLAFAIKHARHGYYVAVIFKTKTDKITSINQTLQRMPEIIRHKLTLKEEIKTPQRIEQVEEEKAVPVTQPVEKDKQEERVEEKKVDIQELDRKIDELLAEHDI